MPKRNDKKKTTHKPPDARRLDREYRRKRKNVMRSLGMLGKPQGPQKGRAARRRFIHSQVLPPTGTYGSNENTKKARLAEWEQAHSRVAA